MFYDSTVCTVGIKKNIKKLSLNLNRSGKVPPGHARTFQEDFDVFGPIQRGQYPVSSKDNCSSVMYRDLTSYSDFQ